MRLFMRRRRGWWTCWRRKSGERILDLGCGTGVLTSEIAGTGAKGYLESTGPPEMVAQAKSKFPALKFEVVDATKIEFDGEFDAVFSNAVLHWIPEAEKVVRGIARALKPGGRFVAEFGGKGNIQTLVKAFHRAFAGLGMSEPEDVSPWFYPGIAEYAALLEKHGVEVRSAALFERPTVLEDGSKGLENWIRLFRQTFVEKMGEEAAARWIREVERQCQAELFQDGDWVLDYRRLRITLIRIKRSWLAQRTRWSDIAVRTIVRALTSGRQHIDVAAGTLANHQLTIGDRQKLS